MRFDSEFRVKPGRKLRLKGIDPAYCGHHTSEQDAKPAIAHYREKMARLQTLLYADRAKSVLIVLQGLDAAGKDGTVNHVLSALNPQGVSVTGFKTPTPAELAHDFLWRVHPHAPGKGEIAVFNRSHYEDVLVTRVHKLIDKPTWKERYKRIRGFEELLVEDNTLILKFYLHISKDEQLARFAQRLDDPARNWKISESDYTERAFWDAYIAAFEDAIEATTTKTAPWFVIPANHKWFRNLAVSQIIADAMEGLNLRYPKPTADLAQIRRQYHAAAREEKGAAKLMASKNPK